MTLTRSPARAVASARPRRRAPPVTSAVRPARDVTPFLLATRAYFTTLYRGPCCDLHIHDHVATPLGERRTSAGHQLAGQDGVHGHLEAARARAAPGASPERRWRWTGR